MIDTKTTIAFGLLLAMGASPVGATFCADVESEALYTRAGTCREGEGSVDPAAAFVGRRVASVCAHRRSGKVAVRDSGCRVGEVGVDAAALIGRGSVSVLCAGHRSGRVRWRFLECRRSERRLDAARVLGLGDPIGQDDTCGSLLATIRSDLMGVRSNLEQLQAVQAEAFGASWDDVAYVFQLAQHAMEPRLQRIGALMSVLGLEDGSVAVDAIRTALADGIDDPTASLEPALAGFATLEAMVPEL